MVVTNPPLPLLIEIRNNGSFYNIKTRALGQILCFVRKIFLPVENLWIRCCFVVFPGDNHFRSITKLVLLRPSEFRSTLTDVIRVCYRYSNDT